MVGRLVQDSLPRMVPKEGSQAQIPGVNPQTNKRLCTLHWGGGGFFRALEHVCFTNRLVVLSGEFNVSLDRALAIEGSMDLQTLCSALHLVDASKVDQVGQASHGVIPEEPGPGSTVCPQMAGGKGVC